MGVSNYLLALNQNSEDPSLLGHLSSLSLGLIYLLYVHGCLACTFICALLVRMVAMKVSRRQLDPLEMEL